MTARQASPCRRSSRRASPRSKPAPRHEDFDALSWVWMVLFGVALPAALIVLGW